MNDTAPGVVTGLIDMVCKETTGSLAISFSKPVVLEIAKNMLRINTEVIDDMVQALVGEMANMMAGGAKAIFEQQGYNFYLTLPSVLAGENHKIKHGIDGVTILFPFTTNAGEFYVEACLN
jgi:chemotaxis protein CheX